MEISTYWIIGLSITLSSAICIIYMLYTVGKQTEAELESTLQEQKNLIDEQNRLNSDLHTENRRLAEALEIQDQLLKTKE